MCKKEYEYAYADLYTHADSLPVRNILSGCEHSTNYVVITDYKTREKTLYVTGETLCRAIDEVSENFCLVAEESGGRVWYKSSTITRERFKKAILVKRLLTACLYLPPTINTHINMLDNQHFLYIRIALWNVVNSVQKLSNNAEFITSNKEWCIYRTKTLEDCKKLECEIKNLKIKTVIVQEFE